MPGIDYTIGAKVSGFQKGIEKATSGLRSMAGTFAKIAPPVAAIGGIAGLTAGLGKAISKASEMEGLETAFMPLLGSADAARDRIEELSRFAAETPFELPGIANASRTLETLTRGALSTGEGLRMVGDVAAATGRPFEEISTTIGRLYDGLDSGRPVGEAMARLQELGVISGDTRAELENLQSQGVKGAEAWAVAENAMGRFSGGMKQQSSTWNGLMSTFRDNIGLAFAKFGTPIIDNIKPFLQGAVGAAGTLAEKAAEFGQKVGESIGFIAAAFKTGNVTTIIGQSLKIAFMESVNFLWKTLRASISGAGQLIVETFRTGITLFEVLTKADFWVGMGKALVGLILDAVGFLQRGIAEAMELLRPIAKFFGKGDMLDSAQDYLRDSAAGMEEAAAGLYDDAKEPLEEAMSKISGRLAEAGNNIAGRFQEQFAATADLMDSSDARAELSGTIAEVRGFMEANRKSAIDTAAIVAKATSPTDAAGDETTTGAPADAAAAETAAGSRAQVDRLRKIGGFVTAGLGAAKDRVAERTEQWTKQTAQAVTKIANRAVRDAVTAVF